MFKTYYMHAVFCSFLKKKKKTTQKKANPPQQQKTQNQNKKKKATTKKPPKPNQSNKKKPHHGYFCVVQVFLSCLVVSKPIFFPMHFVTPEYLGDFHIIFFPT